MFLSNNQLDSKVFVSYIIKITENVGFVVPFLFRRFRTSDGAGEL